MTAVDSADVDGDKQNVTNVSKEMRAGQEIVEPTWRGRGLCNGPCQLCALEQSGRGMEERWKLHCQACQAYKRHRLRPNKRARKAGADTGVPRSSDPTAASLIIIVQFTCCLSSKHQMAYQAPWINVPQTTAACESFFK